MESKFYAGAFNYELLSQEVLDAFPEWRTEFGQVALFGWNVLDDGIIFNAPDGTDWTKVDAIIAAHDPLAETRELIFAKKIFNMAQSSVGVRLQDLTAAQVKALMACLLFKAGGVNEETLVVKPLREWVY